MDAINFDKALSTILSAVQPLPAENVSLDHALGRVTAARVVADEDAVPFPRSAMDGYAVRASECTLAIQGNPIELPVAGQVFAEKGKSTLGPGTALTITTGAPIPLCADATNGAPTTQPIKAEANKVLLRLTTAMTILFDCCGKGDWVRGSRTEVAMTSGLWSLCDAQ